MANICDVRMRIASKSKQSIIDFALGCRDRDFRVYNGIFTLDEDVDESKIIEENGAFAYDCAFGCAWSFVTAFEEDGVNAMFGDPKPSHREYLHELCAKRGVGVEAYSEEPGCCFEEHYLISPSGEILISDCVEMHEVEDDSSETGWRKVGGFGDPDFMSPREILGAE